MSSEKTEPAFTPEQREALAAVLDSIIPPSADGRMPGAGEVGVAAYVDAALRGMPELRAMFAESLAALESLARERRGRPLAELTSTEKAEVVAELAAGEHALPPVVMIHGFAGYYQQPRVLEALGLEARPPHPAGYPLENGDLELLEPVRRRGVRFRAV